MRRWLALVLLGVCGAAGGLASGLPMPWDAVVGGVVIACAFTIGERVE